MSGVPWAEWGGGGERVSAGIFRDVAPYLPHLRFRVRLLLEVRGEWRGRGEVEGMGFEKEGREWGRNNEERGWE